MLISPKRVNLAHGGHHTASESAEAGAGGDAEKVKVGSLRLEVGSIGFGAPLGRGGIGGDFSDF